jgi:hypothetical protein
MSLAAAFAEIGQAFSAAFGGPYHEARVIDETPPQRDSGGSIVTPGQPIYRECMCQIDSATQRMREAAGYVDKDVAFLVLAETLEGGLGTQAMIEVMDGPHAGLWTVSLIERDTVGAGWVGRGRRA